jgi:outer membrane receptor protein involved in Fe transport
MIAKRPRGGLALALGLIGSTALVAPAFAAAPASVSDASASSTVGEVVVTAEKRSSTVQKTPISITVITGEQLQAQGISSVSQIAQQVPGISFKSSGPGQTEFEMRGLTSTGGESPTVGFYLDETPLTPPAMAQNGKVVIDPDLFDLARVEVLRGPQGTLYGAGSMGGTIKLVTNQPNLQSFGASAEVIGSGTEGAGQSATENLMLNIPVVKDVLALRVVGTNKWVGGWIDRDVLDPFPLETNGSTTRGPVTTAPVAQEIKNANWERLQGARATVTYQPTDRLTITPSVLFQRINQGGPNTIDNPPGNKDVHYQPYNVAEPFRDGFFLTDLTAKYDFGPVQATSATAYWNRQQFQTQDISEAMQDYIGSFFGPAADFPYSTFGPGSISEKDNTNQVSEEVRLNSTGSGPFQWLVGGYYSSFNATSHVYSYYPVGGGFDEDFDTTNLADNHRVIKVDQVAAFGEASYAFTDQLKATVGLRYFSYNSHSVTQVSGVSANGTSDPLYSKASNQGVTPKFNIAYTPTPDLDIYATAAEGFRPGGPNSPIPSSCDAALAQLGLSAAPTQFGPDTVWSYELGEKARFADHRVTVNGDVYYEDWSGVQQQVAPACGFKFTANAGRATIYGAEIEVAVKLTPELTLTQNGGYTNATNSTTVPGAGVVKGQRLLDVPDWTANTSLTYEAPINDQFKFVGRVTNSYVGSMQDITYSRNTLPGYDLVDLRAGIATSAWSAFFFIDNLTNKLALLSNTGALSANVPIFNRVTVNQPRTFGVDLSYRY